MLLATSAILLSPLQGCFFPLQVFIQLKLLPSHTTKHHLHSPPITEHRHNGSERGKLEQGC